MSQFLPGRTVGRRAFRAAGLALVLAACGGGQGEAPPTAAERASLAVVVAGAGEPPAAAVAAIRRAVDEELPALGKVFPGMPKQRFFVHVHASREALPEALAAHLQPDSPGFALLGRHQVHLVWGEMRRIGASLRGVVVHELVHELLDQFVAPHGARMPRWFHEGLAQTIAGDTYLGAREEDLVWRLAARTLPSFGDLRERFPTAETELRLAYAQSYSYVAWLERQYGLDALLRIAAAVDERTSFEHALVGRTGKTTLELEESWKDNLQHGSGATWRAALNQCFSLVMIAALPVLALALIRRLAADRRAAAKLERDEAAAAEAAATAPADADEPRAPDD